jgi:hypothetical protein
MDRRKCILQSLAAGAGLCTGSLFLAGFTEKNNQPQHVPDEEVEQLKQQKEFIQNWLHDLLDTMDKELDLPTKVKLIEGCGRGCFNRFKFKQDIAAKGANSLDNLIEAYKQNFEIWKDGNLVHIRYGEVSAQCYCPAANYRAPKPNDVHCECTRTTHQTIFETALGRPFKVDILESLRRGGKTCHFAVHLT